MRQLGFVTAAALVLMACAGGALAGGPPIVNETVHPVDEAYFDIGGNCVTGQQSERTVTFSGVLRTLVRADGSYVVRGNTWGDTILDDLPADGIPDTTSHFRFVVGDIVLPSGNSVYSEVWNGTATALATGTEVKFHVTYKLVLDPSGSPKIEILRIACD